MEIKIGCHCVVKKEGRILLGLRNKPSSGSHGQYFTVGGTLEFLETIEQCLRREVMEEVGIEIKDIQFVKYYEHIYPEKNVPHVLVFAFTAEYAGGELKGGDDCVDPQFFTKEEIQKMVLENKLGRFAKEFLTDLKEI